MAASHTIVFAAVLSCLLVCGRADLCAPDCRGGSDLNPHPQDCNSFYQCSDGTSFLKHCPAGLEFSPTGLVCDYPAQAGCNSDPARECEAAPVTPEASQCIPACPTPEALYPHPHDCTKYFHCAHSVPYLKLCPAGQEYSGPLRRCDYPNLAKCTAHAEAPCLAATYAPTTASPLTEAAPVTPEASQCTPACPTPYALYPHPRDCTKYFHCAHNVPYLKPCPAGQEYSGPLRRCDYPDLAKCTAHAEAPCLAATYDPTITSPKTCTPKCPWANAYIPHPQDCTKFYICGGMVPFETSCQSGLVYDMKLIRCEYPENALCIASPNRACDEYLKA